MPLERISSPVGLSITVEDYNGEQAVTEVFYPNGVDLDGLLAEIATIEAAVAALSDGLIVGGGITIPLIQTTAPPAQRPASSNVQRKGKFVFRNAAGTYNTYQIPSIDRALVQEGSNAIIVGDAAVQAYINLLLNGFAPLATPAVGGGGQDLSRFVRAYEDTSKGGRRGNR